MLTNLTLTNPVDHSNLERPNQFLTNLTLAYPVDHANLEFNLSNPYKPDWATQLPLPIWIDNGFGDVTLFLHLRRLLPFPQQSDHRSATTQNNRRQNKRLGVTGVRE